MSERDGIGRSLSDGRDGFIPKVRVVVVVLIVLDLVGPPFAEYGGSVVVVVAE